MQLLEASVVQYEDVVNSSNELITKYIVQVKLASTVNYNISKRYSEFKTLFEIMKDVIPPDYKFPNKSMFHNSAQATKERRVRGFDQLLQILLSRKPLPTVIERFLGINERKSKSLQIRSKSLTLRKNPSIPGTMNEIAEDGFTSAAAVGGRGSDGSNNDALEQTVIPEYQPSGKEEIMYSAEKFELIRSLRKEAPQIITSSMKMTSLVYISLVVIRVIDISNSDFYEILVTMVVISFAVAFVRINLMKRDLTLEITSPSTQDAAVADATVTSAPTVPASVLAAAVVVPSDTKESKRVENLTLAAITALPVIGESVASTVTPPASPTSPATPQSVSN